MIGNNNLPGGVGRTPDAGLVINNNISVVAPDVVSTVNGSSSSFPVSDLISADTPNEAILGSDGLILVKPKVVFDDQVITMVDTPSINGTLTPSSPTGADNQIDYTFEAEVNISTATTPYPNAITINPDGLYVPATPDVLTTYTDTTIAPKHKIGEYKDELGVVTVVNQTVSTLTNNNNGTFTYTDETGLSTTVSTVETVSYQVDSTSFPASPISGDEMFVTTDGTQTGFIKEQWIFDGTTWTKRPKVDIVIPTPRIHTLNKAVQYFSNTDINTLSSTPWAIPEVFAQHFSPDDAVWRGLNPVYELVVHKYVRGGSGKTNKGYRWVHPVNENSGAGGKKYAGGKTWNQAINTVWQDRRTEWTVDSASVVTYLKRLDPHDFISYQSSDLNTGGVNPIVGAYREDKFEELFWFSPKRAFKGNTKMAFSVRIRIDNPEFITGVAKQEPYLYGDVSNVLVFRPKMYNFWDGATLDFAGNQVLDHYYHSFVATEENSTQN